MLLGLILASNTHSAIRKGGAATEGGRGVYKGCEITAAEGGFYCPPEEQRVMDALTARSLRFVI